MIEYRSNQLDHIFHALADPTRRAVLRELTGGRRSVGQLAKPFPISFAAVTKHIQVLEKAGLVRKVRQGKFIQCRLQGEPLRLASAWIEQQRAYWQSQLDGLERFLDEN